jgi:hypothetical protein
MTAENDALHRQLIRLGDMMGDGQHHERGGAWIAKEYRATAKALGYGPPRKPRVNRGDQIDTAMKARLAVVRCEYCDGPLVQTRAGAKRARCLASNCRGLFQLLK